MKLEMIAEAYVAFTVSFAITLFTIISIYQVYFQFLELTPEIIRPYVATYIQFVVKLWCDCLIFAFVAGFLVRVAVEIKKGQILAAPPTVVVRDNAHLG